MQRSSACLSTDSVTLISGYFTLGTCLHEKLRYSHPSAPPNAGNSENSNLSKFQDSRDPPCDKSQPLTGHVLAWLSKARYDPVGHCRPLSIHLHKTVAVTSAMFRRIPGAAVLKLSN